MIAAVFVVIAGAFGVAGVGMAAAAAHLGEGALLKTASEILLPHAGAMLGIAAVQARGGRGVGLAGALIAAGAAVFAADLAMRALFGLRLFPMAAPIGGGAMMLGWLALALVGMWRAGSGAARRRSAPGEKRAR